MNDHRLIDGRAVQQKLLGEIAAFVKNITQEKPIGRLVSVSIGDVAEVDVYIRNQERAAVKVGIPFERCAWSATITQAEAKAQLVAMNDDPNVLGVILQRPVPDTICLLYTSPSPRD